MDIPWCLIISVAITIVWCLWLSRQNSALRRCLNLQAKGIIQMAILSDSITQNIENRLTSLEGKVPKDNIVVKT